ncbi:MAG: RsmE family RNA methyltransferase [Pseudomonadota bacterium]
MKFSHLPRIHTSEHIHKKQTIIMGKDDFHYLKSVIRIRKFETFRLFNSQDGEFLVTVKEINRASLQVEVDSQIREVNQEKDLELALCIIKQDRMIEAIKSAVQLGVTRIIPLISNRTQYKQISREKIQKCIIQSVQQSERFAVPALEQELSLSDFCEKYNNQQIIFACESESEDNKISNIDMIQDKPIILIGPEGGFNNQEIAMVRSMSKAEPVSLGRTVLRAEVAVASALACVSMIRS